MYSLLPSREGEPLYSTCLGQAYPLRNRIHTKNP